MSDTINEITLSSQEVEQFLHLLFAGRVVSKEPLPEDFERTLYLKIFSVYKDNREAMFTLKVKGNEEELS